MVERRKRKGPILTPSSLPCLGKMPTINITEGCVHNCVYCYTQGYRSYPGQGRVVLFDNIPELLRAELPRKRKKPHRVYFSPSSDAFQPLDEVQDVTFETMSILLARGVEIAFLTKGVVDERFAALFAKSSTSVHAQIGVTTTNPRLWELLETGAACPAERLETIERLTRIGVSVRVRLDPLIPGLTDRADNLRPLLSELSRRGVRSIVASYLFLRPGFAQRVSRQLEFALGSSWDIGAWSGQNFVEGLGSGRMISTEERQARFTQLRDLAAGFGIDVHVCACKNPRLQDNSDCKIAGPSPNAQPEPDTPLFF
ncbi:MAG: radical SAM protein [Phycisphaerales bacterium]|nr:radical SAM protein [Phycisphaerales bacterium]